MEERRSERNEDFAPPQMYKEQTGGQQTVTTLVTHRQKASSADPMLALEEKSTKSLEMSACAEADIVTQLRQIRNEVEESTTEQTLAPNNPYLPSSTTAFESQTTQHIDFAPLPAGLLLPPPPPPPPPALTEPAQPSGVMSQPCDIMNIHLPDSQPHSVLNLNLDAAHANHANAGKPFSSEQGSNFSDTVKIPIEAVISKGASLMDSMPNDAANQSENAYVDSARPVVQADPNLVLCGAPQPVHYVSGPMKPQAKKPRYERVNMHEVPLTLPMPPTVGKAPCPYPSQEEVHGPWKHDDSLGTNPGVSHKARHEQSSEKNWQKQFQYHGGTNKSSSLANLKPDSIPFASPYIRKQDNDVAKQDKIEAEFDPSRPPPPLKDKDSK